MISVMQFAVSHNTFMANDCERAARGPVYFADADNCRNYLVAHRWLWCGCSGGVAAMYLSSEVQPLAAQRQAHLAANDRKTGTIMGDSDIPLRRYVDRMFCEFNNVRTLQREADELR